MAGVPLTPLLNPLDAARAQKLVFRLLFEGAPAEVPVVVLLEDFEPVTEERFESLGLDLDEAFDDAAEARGDEDEGSWAAQTIPVKGGGGLTVLVRQGEGVDVEDVLVASILDEAAKQLGTSALAVALPARGVVLATDATQKWQLVAAFSTAARMQHAQAGDEAVWPGVLRVESGRVTGVIDVSTASLDAAAARSGPSSSSSS